jgi:hypothetical protein
MDTQSGALVHGLKDKTSDAGAERLRNQSPDDPPTTEGMQTRGD